MLRILFFAVDTNIYYDSNDLIEIEETFNKELNNRLTLNVGKTNFVTIRANKRINHYVTLILNRKGIEPKDHVKYLRVLWTNILIEKPNSQCHQEDRCQNFSQIEE